MKKKCNCQLLYFMPLPQHNIYLMHLLSSYFADFDFSVFVGQQSGSVVGWTLCERML